MTTNKVNPLKLTGALKFNKSLYLVPWREKLAEYALKYGEIYAVSDTETSDKTIVSEKNGLFNRLLEWSICFCYKDEDGMLRHCVDNNGDMIFVDELSNPFIDNKNKNIKNLKTIKNIPQGSIDVHHITLPYLFAEESSEGRPKLDYPAAPFTEVFSLVMSLLDSAIFKEAKALVHLMFHNAPFDVRFLNHECETSNLSPIESFFGIIDTQVFAASVITKEEIKTYSLDNIYLFGKENYPQLIEDTDRPIHSALLDSLILVEVYNVIAHHAKVNN